MACEKPDWFKIDPAKFLADGLVDAMSTLEIGAIFRLLCRQWLDGYIADDRTLLARQCRMTEIEMEAAWPMISKFFPAIGDGKRANRFMWEERQIVLRAIEAKKSAGRTAAERQWEAKRAATRESPNAISPEPTGSPTGLSTADPMQDTDTDRAVDRDTEETQTPPQAALALVNPSPTEIVSIWNTATAEKLPKARLTSKRETAIMTRLKEPGWLSDFQAACTYLAESAWYQGANDRNWVATVDFALQAGKATELAEKATQPAERTAIGTHDIISKPQSQYQIDAEQLRAERRQAIREAAIQ